MKRKTGVPGNTREQLVIPGMEAILSSADSVASQRSLGKNTYDESWVLTKQANHD